MKIHVLGGNGFVGSAFVRVARQRGHAVAIIHRTNHLRYRGKKCDLLINANGNSRKFLADKDPAAEFDASVVSVQRSLLDFPCKRYVYLSSIDVYPCVHDPRCNHEETIIRPEELSRYGLHKFLAEQLVRRYAPRWLIVRMGGMLGEGLWKNSIYDLLHRQPLRVHSDSCYQYMLTDDVARIVFALTRNHPSNGIFNVCGDGCISLRDVASLIPHCDPKYVTDSSRREHYEISVAKLRKWVRVPRTRDTVKTFVRQQLA